MDPDANRPATRKTGGSAQDGEAASGSGERRLGM
jgi:hypothetical protein